MYRKIKNVYKISVHDDVQKDVYNHELTTRVFLQYIMS